MRRILTMLVWLSLSALTQAQNLVAYYPFNGNANDESGNSRNPTTINAGAALTTDRFGQANRAYSFDGSTGYIEYSATGLPITDRTISLWLNATTVSTKPALLGYGGNSNDGPPGTSFYMGLNLEGASQFKTASHWGTNNVGYAYAVQPIDQWIHWVVVISGNTTKYFINGNKVLDQAGTFSGSTYVTGREFSLGVGVDRIGVAPYTDVNMGYFNGKLDDVRIYDGAMSDAQVVKLYQSESSGLIAYYPFNGNANDETGNGNNSTYIGSGVSLTTDRFGNSNKAFYFDGATGSYIRVPADNFPATNRTISFWFNADDPAVYRTPFSYGGNGCNASCFLMILNQSGTGTYLKSGHCDVERISVPYSTPPVNKWKQWVITINGTEQKIYIDGILQSPILKENFLTPTYVAGRSVLFGAMVNTDGNSVYQDGVFNFKGKLDEIRVYNYPMSDAQVLSLYSDEVGLAKAYYPFNGNANDESGNNHTGTVNGASLSSDRNRQTDKAYNFDGNDYITAAAHADWSFNGGDFSISSWINVNTVSTGRIVSAGYDANNGIWGLGFGSHPSWGNGYRLNFFIHNGSTYVDFNSDEIAGYSAGQWAHVGVTKTGSTITFYYNGNPVGTSSGMTYPANANSYLSIGCRQQTSNSLIEFFNGKIDELRIFKRALSANEMKGFVTDSLIAWYSFSGNAKDTGAYQLHGTAVSVAYTADRFRNSNKAVVFNGVSSVITVKDTAVLRINTELTLSAWVKRTRFGIDMILEKGGDWTGAGTNYGMGLHQINNNMFYFFFKGGWRGTTGVNDFEWHHYTVVAKQGESDPQFYIDGEPRVVQYREGASSIELHQSAADLHLGAQLGANVYYGANILDEIKVFNRRLSALEVFQNFKQEASGLVAYYPFNGNANDESGNGNHGIVNGAVPTTDRFGNANKAYTFTNPNHISVLNSNLFGDEFTLSYWYKISSYFGQRGVVSNVATPNGGFQQASDGTGLSYILGYSFVGGYNPNYFYANYTMQEPLSQWHHLAVTYKKLGSSSSLSKLYIDGVLKQSDAHVMPITFTPYAPFYIGQNHSGLNFQGDLDDISIYNRILSPNEIKQLAEAPVLPNLLVYLPMNGHVRDKSGHHRDGTQYGGASLTTDKYNNVNNALLITNAESGVTIANSNQLDFTGQPFTISAWVKYSNIPALDFPVVSKHNCGTPNGYVLSINNNIPRFYLCSGGNWSLVSAAETYNDNKWHHLVATYDGSGAQKLYVDGVLKASASSVVYNSPAGSTAPVIIGDANGNCGSPNYTGGIDEVKIYGAALDAEQITELYRQSRGSGRAIEFSGKSTNQVLLSESVNPPPGVLTFTLEAWVKRKGTAGKQWIFAGADNTSLLWGFDGERMIFGSATGDRVLGPSVNDDKWHHVAVVCYPSPPDGTAVLFYLDGRYFINGLSVGGPFYISAVPMPVGTYAVGNRPGTTESFDGLLDEVRIWAANISSATLRSWMNRKITPSHPNWENMGYYFNFDEASLSKAYDLRQGVSCDFIDGGSTLWSGAPVGDTSVTDYTSAVKTAMIPFAPNVQFTATGTNGNPDGISVYLVKDPPVSAEGATGTGGIDHYYGVQLIGGTSPSYTAVYQYGGSPLVTPLLEPGLALFSRSDNSVLQWNNSNAVINTTAKTLTVTGQNTEYILGSSGFPLSVPEDGVQRIPLKLYPNPAGSRVTLRGVEQFERVQMFDYSGKLIRDQLINKHPVVEVPLSGVKNGMYQLRLIGKQKIEVLKLIVVQ